MSRRSEIAEVARLLGEVIEKDALPKGGDALFRHLLAEDGVAAAIVDCLFAEARRKRPDNRTLTGCGFMLGVALASLRLDANSGDGRARRAIEATRASLGRATAGGDVAGGILVLVGRAFAEAQLDPGPALQAAMAKAMGAPAIAAQPSPDAFSTQLADLAESLGNDPFAIYADLAAFAIAFPPEQRAAMAGMLARSDVAAVREAALGFVLSPDERVAEGALTALAAPDAAPVSAALVERLVRIRPWLAERRQAAVDVAIRTLRPRALAAKAGPAPELRQVLATPSDGAGAQSIFVQAKRGRRYTVASILLKIGAGVSDAFANDMSKRESDAMVEQIDAATEAAVVSIDFAARRIGAALAINRICDTPPPFGLLQAVEAIGLGALHPEPTPAGTLATSLLAELPPQRSGETARLAAHRASRDWPHLIATTESWFEAGDAVDTLLAPIRSRAKRIDAVLRQHLPTRRLFWAEQCAWTAATLKDDEHEDETWIEFALVARDLAGDRPLDEMPLARRIAEVTVEAFAQR